jgi:hypothetical protein
MSTMKERWTAAKPLVYQQIADEIQRNAIYEPNCPTTWHTIGNRVNELVAPLIPLGYLDEIHVVCDSTNNTEDTIEANEFHLDFAWKLDDATDFTIVSFVISPRGVETIQ